MTPLMEEWSYRCQDVLLVKFMVSKEVFVFMKIGICAIQLQGHHKCFHRKCGNTDLFLEAASITNEAASSVSAFFFIFSLQVTLLSPDTSQTGPTLPTPTGRTLSAPRLGTTGMPLVEPRHPAEASSRG